MLTLQANLGGYCGRCCRPSSTSSCLRIAATSGPCRGPCWGWSSSMRSTLASYGRAWWAASLLTSRPPCPSGLTLSWTALNATCSPRTGTGSPRICLSSGGTSMTLWRALPPWTWWHNIVSDEVALLLPQLVWMASTGLCWSWFCTDISSCHLCPPLTLVFNLVLVLMLWASCSCGSCQKCPKYEYVLLDWQFDECLQKMMELLMYDRHDPCIFIVLERWILGGFQFSVKCYI